MRLPQPFSMHGGSLVAPARDRDATSLLTPPIGSASVPVLDPIASTRLARPIVDFNTVLTGIDQPRRPSSTPSKNDVERPPTPASSRADRQSDSDDQITEDEEFEVEIASEEPVLTIAQPQVLMPEKAPTEFAESAEPVLTADNAVDYESVSGQRIDLELGNPAADSGQISTAYESTRRPSGKQQVESVQTQSFDVAPEADAKPQANDSDPLAQQKNRPTESLPQETKAGVLQPQTAENVGADTTQATPGAIKISPELAVGEGLAEIASPIAVKSLTPATVQSHQQSVATDPNVIQDDFNQNVEPGRRSSRSGQGRTAGIAGRKGTESERATSGNLGDRSVKTKSIDQLSISPQETVAGQSGQPSVMVDAPSPTDVTSGASSIAQGLESATAQGLANTTFDAANRATVGGGTPSESTAIELRSGDSSGQSRDQTSSGKTENLSRTDIADRARLIHRITKAFAKLGVDGGQIRMKLHPETLGGVLLEMRVRGRQVEATVTADNEVARDLLLQQLPELRQRLEGQGMTVNRLEVSLKDDSATGGSLSHNSHGQSFGDQRGAEGFAQSNRGGQSSDASQRSNRPVADDGGKVVNPAATNRMAGPAEPGTLDLRL